MFGSIGWLSGFLLFQQALSLPAVSEGTRRDTASAMRVFCTTTSQ